MFYRIRENKIYDYADYQYANDCLHTDVCSKIEFEQNNENFIVENNEIKLIPNIEEVIAKRRQEKFEKDFFKTSLGNIRRQVRMKNGEIKDFLSDLLSAIKAGIELGQDVKVIVYKTPDFTKDLTEDYMISLQETKTVDLNFVKECLNQTVYDFGI